MIYIFLCVVTICVTALLAPIVVALKERMLASNGPKQGVQSVPDWDLKPTQPSDTPTAGTTTSGFPPYESRFTFENGQGGPN